MHENPAEYPVIVAGGGPVGLFLGCCLQNIGIGCRILEKRQAPITHSRSLGIHPVSLQLFERLDLAQKFVESGIKIYRGQAFANRRQLGSVNFAEAFPPFNFILSLPQFKTEQLLEKFLFNLNPNSLIRGAEITDILPQPHANHYHVVYHKGGRSHHLKGRFLVGCDGKNSFIRQKAGITFSGRRYPDTYLMGDFSDNTSFGNDAAVFLHSEGLIESFPLGDNFRRWVIKTDHYISNPSRRQIEELLKKRLGTNLRNEQNTMISSFGVQRLLAESFYTHNIALAGDAAHVVSPIGGQGMNLGWLDSWDLAMAFQQIFHHGADSQKELHKYSRQGRRRAQKALRRAELNMRLGRKHRFHWLKNIIVWGMLNSPLNHVMRNLFTMQKLKKWPF